jgi:hypothetical protein
MTISRIAARHHEVVDDRNDAIGGARRRRRGLLGLDKVEAVGHRDVSPNVRTAGYLRRA